MNEWPLFDLLESVGAAQLWDGDLLFVLSSVLLPGTSADLVEQLRVGVVLEAGAAGVASIYNNIEKRKYFIAYTSHTKSM